MLVKKNGKYIPKYAPSISQLDYPVIGHSRSHFLPLVLKTDGTSVVVPYCSCCLCLYFGSAIMLGTYFVNFRWLNDHLFGKELFILFAASAFRKLSSIYVFSYFPFGFEGGIWDLIISVPDHCLSFYFDLLVAEFFLCCDLSVIIFSSKGERFCFPLV